MSWCRRLSGSKRVGTALHRHGLSRTESGSLTFRLTHANRAAAIRGRTGVSIADAHLGAVMAAASGFDITVISSDPRDMREVAGDTNVTIVAI